MSHFYFNRWEFNLTLEALTDIHLGSGVLDYIEIEGELREVMLHAKCVGDKAYLPSASLKGAMRATAKAAGLDEKLLFGKVTGKPEDARAGCVVVFGATLSDMTNAIDAPGFNRGSGTYIRPQHARDRNTRTVLPHYLYHIENTPKGSRFTLQAIFFQPKGNGNTVEDILKPLLDRLAAADGFSIGGQKTTLGRMRLVNENVEFTNTRITRVEEPCDGRVLVRTGVKSAKCEMLIEPSSQAIPQQDIYAPGPLLIADPKRAGTVVPIATGRKKTITELRHKEGDLAGWERALRQSLRALAGYLEATLDCAARDRIDDPFVPFADFASLHSTQRLFGVEGYRGLLSLHVFTATHTDRGKFPGLELDALTQGALAHAAYAIDCPVNGTVRMRAGIDLPRYRDLLGTIDDEDKRRTVVAQDRALVFRLNAHVAKHGVQAGAKVTRGYGWFAPFALDLKLGEYGDV